MKVFKFGGASIKNEEAIKNMAGILQKYQQEEVLVVVSAMGSSTNHLEQLIQLAWQGKNSDTVLEEFAQFHIRVCKELFREDSTVIESKVMLWMDDLKTKVKHPPFESGFSFFYDSVVCTGELLSSEIISEYLNYCKIASRWVDARTLIKTDNNHREGSVDWQVSSPLIQNTVTPVLKSGHLVLTQGFIASTDKGATTTLGREGSDFTAAIFACAIQAESVTIWKDVAGILNADPKRVPEAKLFDQLSYVEAAEMTYYGAKVIHPKTIKPLANKNIPLLVKCFEAPENKGTKIHDCEHQARFPSVVFKSNQCLLSLKVIDFSFINEKSMHQIFKALDELHITINLMQNSAISFSICFDYDPFKLEKLMQTLEGEYEMYYNTGLDLVTIKNYDDASLQQFKPGNNILLEQKSRSNYRALYTP